MQTDSSLEEISNHAISRTISIQCNRAGFSSVQPTALNTLSYATSHFLETLLSAAVSNAEIAGRARPCPLDVTRALAQKGISLAALETELCTSRPFPYRTTESSQRTGTMAVQPTQQPSQHLKQNTASDGFFTHRPFSKPTIDDTVSQAAIALIPEDREIPRPDYVPDHLPPFPPRHTYLETPVFEKRETNPVLLRQIGAEQSRLVEDSLKRLLAVEVQTAAYLATTTPSHDVLMQDVNSSSPRSPEQKTNPQQQYSPQLSTIHSISAIAPIANYEAMRQLEARKKSKAGKLRGRARPRISS